MKVILSQFFYCLLMLSAFAQDASGYLLQKDDKVRLTVFQEPELSVDHQIDKTGHVSFPLIGSIKLSGKSIPDAEKEITDLYADGFLVSPQVNLAIVDYAKFWVIVGGDVNRPGTIHFPEEGALSLLGAVAQAGGQSESADIGKIIVKSASGKTRYYNLESSGDKVLSHKDSVIVTRMTQQQATVTMSGNVRSPGTVTYPKVGKLDIMTAIAMSGGFDRYAYRKAVTIHRDQRQYLVDLRAIETGKAQMFYLEPGDLVVVRESKL